jgi:quercetin dioxygenase-like cupin family protein
MQRRSFLGLALATLPLTTLGQSPGGASTARAVRVPSGEDREGKSRAIGVSSTTYKVLTRDTGGALFAMEQSNSRKGGPTRHLHHDQDEFFYVLEGEYVIEIGADRFNLKAGDSVLAPREVPHAWAFVGNTTGRLLISFTPAGKMEAFFGERGNRGIGPGQYSNDAAFLHAYGMELVGPPLKLE